MAVGYAPDWLSMLGSQINPNYTDYSGYDPSGLQSQGYGNQTSGYSPEVQAAVDARNNSGISTRDVYGQGGVTHEERATPQRDNSAGATNFQSAFADDPYYQRQDIAPFISATNEDVRGGGKYGIRGWMNEHPVGVMGAFAALAAGGAALTGLGGAGGAGGAVGQHALPASYGAGGGTGSGLGIFSNGGAGGLAGVGAGNAGRLASSGLLEGGAAAGAGVPSWLSGANSLLGSNLGQAATSLLGGGQQGGNVELPYMGLGSNYGKPTQQQQPQRMLGSQMPNILPSMNQPLMNFGRKPLQFSGTTVWV